MTQELLADQLIKACFPTSEQSGLVRGLVGDTLHPGGLDLTRELGKALRLEAWDRVVNVSSGWGAGPVFLAREFGCKVVGIGQVEEQVSEARQRAFKAKLFEKVTFGRGDPESLPERDGTCDVVVCESALSSFPDKLAAIGEMYRVLAQHGRLGITDVALQGRLPSELSSLAATVTCIGMALSTEGYRTTFVAQGFRDIRVKDHTETLRDFVKRLQQKVLMAHIAVSSGGLKLEGADFKEAQNLLQAVQGEIERGNLGYILLTATK